MPSEPLFFASRSNLGGWWSASWALTRGTAEAHPERCRVSLFSLLLGNDEHNPSGFDVPEHFREPEVPGQENHD